MAYPRGSTFTSSHVPVPASLRNTPRAGLRTQRAPLARITRTLTLILSLLKGRGIGKDPSTEPALSESNGAALRIARSARCAHVADSLARLASSPSVICGCCPHPRAPDALALSLDRERDLKWTRNQKITD